MVNSEHHVIYVPGLNNDLLLHRASTSLLPIVWQLHGFHGHVVLLHWSDGNEIQPKLDKVLGFVGDLAARGHLVSLVGQSAGGSVVVNAFVQRPDLVTGVVNIAGRLRTEGETGLAEASRDNPAFAESVRRCEQALPGLTMSQRARIMTIRPRVDFVVPSESVAIDGAQNLVAPVRGHSMGGAQVVSVRAGQWLEFLKATARQEQGARSMPDMRQTGGR
jgi:pimeloyl-ACP methyl ester carboxylesterase